MALLLAPSPSPARVHERARMLCGHSPTWIKPNWRGGLWFKEHYRTCSYCGCIHPVDMAELLEAGRSRLQPVRPDKYLFLTPNPIAGELVRMGSIPGAVFEKHAEPADLVSSLLLAAKPGFTPTIGERLSGHYELPCWQPAPEMIEQPLYAEHTTPDQWAAIEAAAQGA